VEKVVKIFLEKWILGTQGATLLIEKRTGDRF
jgi:hypothetical protein